MKKAKRNETKLKKKKRTSKNHKNKKTKQKMQKFRMNKELKKKITDPSRLLYSIHNAAGFPVELLFLLTT